MRATANWNILPSLYRGPEGQRNINKAHRDVQAADSILDNMRRMKQDRTPLFHQWKSVRASRFSRYQRLKQLRRQEEQTQ